KMFSRAVEYECIQAIYMLGTMYYNGLGVSKNLKKAIEFFEGCSSRGHSDASAILAEIYEIAPDFKNLKLADHYTQLSREQKQRNGGVVEDYGFDMPGRYREESSVAKPNRLLLFETWMVLIIVVFYFVHKVRPDLIQKLLDLIM
ncbi:MAG: sel1 repeat family protein, partial [Alphaproteobacteria bacterium]|nr:sel1 repeat family protein [Alphaproteobacteria bacterium]